MKKRLLNIALVVLLIIFVFSASVICYHFITRMGYEKDFKKLAKNAPAPSEVLEDPQPAISYFEELYSQNSDTYCFLTVPDTQINYPVVKTPHSPEYYLRRDFFKNYSYYGVPFAETRIPDGTGFEIIYGHHIRGSKMFGELINYNKQSWFDLHKNVYLYTADGVEQYTVFASVYTTGADKGKLYARPINGIVSEQEFNQYIIDVYEYSTTRDWNNIPKYGSKILILSTCEYSKTDGRYMVFAVKK